MTLSPDTGFEIRALAVWGRERYLSVTEAPHNTDFHTLMGKKHFCFFQTAETGNGTPNSGVKGSGANHHPRAPPVSPSVYHQIIRKPLNKVIICFLGGGGGLNPPNTSPPWIRHWMVPVVHVLFGKTAPISYNQTSLTPTDFLHNHRFILPDNRISPWRELYHTSFRIDINQKTRDIKQMLL